MTATDSEKVSVVLPPDKGMADTPDLLGDALIQAVDTDGACTWLDPSAGSGQLVRAALRAGVDCKSILAVDLQTRLPTLTKLGVESLLGTDFLTWAQETDRQFDRVVANPPFVRLRELDERLFRSAVETRLNGLRIPASGNYWAVFLVAGMRLLKPGGSLAYILPAAWEYANYASELRSLCTASFRELDVHRVSIPMFDKVSDGSVLLVGRDFGQRSHRTVRVMRHKTLSALNEAIRNGEIPVAARGLRQHELGRLHGHVRFGEIAHIRIGAVTGDAPFFLLNETRRRTLGIPRSAVRPILSKARHIVAAEIDQAAWAELLAADKAVWLFAPSDTDMSDFAVRAYLDIPEEDGGCRRSALKVRERDPWYRVPIPKSFDGFMTGMSQSIPWVALNRMPGLTASNTLYGVCFRSAWSIDERAAWCLSMLSSTTAESRARLVRQYPQGLLKLEPSDMASLVVRRPKTAIGARDLYRKAVELIVSGDSQAAQTMADEWLESPTREFGS